MISKPYTDFFVTTLATTSQYGKVGFVENKKDIK